MEQQVDTTDVFCFENLPLEMQQLIFRYCGARTRREITLVCKDWAKKLEYFREDFRVYLQYCYLREDLEPVSLLMNSTRRCQFLCLRDGIHAESKEVLTRFFSHLGREVQDLDISLVDNMFLEDPDFLLLFPKLKKLSVESDDLRTYKSFPKTLEHVHLADLTNSEDLEHLRSIKNLRLLTSDEFDCVTGCSGNFNFDEHLKAFYESMLPFEFFIFESNKNLLSSPIITFDDMLRVNGVTPLVFSSLNKFLNLRSICVWFNFEKNPVPYCFNFHKPVLCATVTKLELVDCKQSCCFECFKSIIDSFPNLTNIILDRFKIANQHVKYIFLKMPKLIHLDTDSENLNHESICHDQPESLMNLETLILSKFTADNMFLHWPFMPHLKTVQFGEVSDDSDINKFTEKTPNLESFQIGYGSLLSGTGIEMIAKHWPNLRTLILHSKKPCDVSPIKRFCRNLRKLDLGLDIDSVHTYSSFFDAIPTLKELKLKKGGTKDRYLKEIQKWD